MSVFRKSYTVAGQKVDAIPRLSVIGYQYSSLLTVRSETEWEIWSNKFWYEGLKGITPKIALTGPIWNLGEEFVNFVFGFGVIPTLKMGEINDAAAYHGVAIFSGGLFSAKLPEDKGNQVIEFLNSGYSTEDVEVMLSLASGYSNSTVTTALSESSTHLKHLSHLYYEYVMSSLS